MVPEEVPVVLIQGLVLAVTCWFSGLENESGIVVTVLQFMYIMFEVHVYKRGCE